MIGGNTLLAFQVATYTKNEIGKRIPDWQTVQTIKGFLDHQSGDSGFNSYNAKIQESTHIFIADYVQLDASIKAEKCMAVINGERYDVKVIDDPMGLHKHLEIYLKYTGGQ